MNSLAIVDWRFVIAGLVAGYLIGSAHFAHLKYCTSLYLDANHPVKIAVHSLLRFGGTLVAFLLLAKLGAAAALAGLAGFTLARRRAVSAGGSP